MSLQVNYITTEGNIHTGTGFLFLNILRPLYLMNPRFDGSNPPNYLDPPTPGTWAATTVETTRATIIDTNNNLQMVTSSPAGTTGSTEPASWATNVGGTATDGTVTWTNIGPSWIWKASTPVLNTQQVRDSNGNIQVCLTPGATGATAPTWATQRTAITNDGTASWINYGPTLASGAVEGAVEFTAKPTLLKITADQTTSTIDHRMESETAGIGGTLEELNLSLVGFQLAGSVYSSDSDPTMPSGAQNFESVTGGGLLAIVEPCVCVCSPRPNYANPSRYVSAWLHRAAPANGGQFPFSLKKVTGYKVDWEGDGVGYYPAGAQLYGFNRML